MLPALRFYPNPGGRPKSAHTLALAARIRGVGKPHPPTNEMGR